MDRLLRADAISSLAQNTASGRSANQQVAWRMARFDGKVPFHPILRSGRPACANTSR
jgi:hypothetical protein